METSAKINLIRDRNYKIRHAVEAIKPVPYPSNQQAIRVIREEVDRIEWTLTEVREPTPAPLAPRARPRTPSSQRRLVVAKSPTTTCSEGSFEARCLLSRQTMRGVVSFGKNCRPPGQPVWTLGPGPGPF